MRNLILLLLFLSTTINPIFSQKTHYYESKNKKIEFEIVDSLRFIELNSNPVLLTQLKNIYLKSKNSCIINSSELQKIKNTDIKDIKRVLRYNDGTIQICTNEFFIKTLQNIDISLILENNKVSYDSIHPMEYMENTHLVYLKNDNDVFTLINKLTKLKEIEYAEPNFIRIQESEIQQKEIKQNELYNTDIKNWGLSNSFYNGIDLNVNSAWKITKGNPNVKIAVFDDGVDYNHPDLRNNVLNGYNASTDTNDGYPMSPDKRHGTQCAGVIAACENGLGTIGVAPECKIIPIVLGNTDMKHIKGFNFAYNQNVHVISCSWRLLTGSPSTTLSNRITEISKKGRNNKGTIIVFSSGNAGTDTINTMYTEGVISVGAISQNGYRCYFSNYGNKLDLVAPGESIYTTDRGDSYEPFFTGTSASCPFVSGVAALLFSTDPNLEAAKVKDAIFKSCKKLTGYNYSWNSEKQAHTNYETGRGLVNAFDALSTLLSKNINGPELICDCETPTFSIDKNLKNYDRITWRAEFGVPISQDEKGSATFRVDFPDSYGYAQTITATAHYNNDSIIIQRHVHVGSPETLDIIYDENPIVMEYLFVNALFEGATDYEWYKLKGNCGVWGNGNRGEIMPYDTKPATVVVKAINKCGYYEEWISFTASYSDYMKSKKRLQEMEEIKDVNIYDIKGVKIATIKSKSTKSINLPRGIYIIEWIENDKVQREKVFISNKY